MPKVQREHHHRVYPPDHGDYLGDHWMGDKDFYHEAAVKVPLIIADPRPEADGTRGLVSDALVEMIDLPATFMQALGCAPKPHVIEGRDLTSILHGKDGFTPLCDPVNMITTGLKWRPALGQPQGRRHTTMIFDGR